MELNFANNLFLGKEELNHFKESLGVSGYKRMFQQVVESYGVVKLPSDVSFDALKVVQGSLNGLISVNAGKAIDANIDVIDVTSTLADVLTVPGDGVTRYVKIKYLASPVEQGTVNINASGQVVGTGTNFTERLRGLPNFPSVIKFEDSTNTQEYTVASVIDDFNLQLNVTSGILNVESGKQYSIVGTFTPGVAVPSGSKYPMQNDRYELTLELTDTVIPDMEFILASVVNDGAITTITDLRGTIDPFSIGGSSTGDMTTSSALIGHYGVRRMLEQHPRHEMLLTTQWGFLVDSGDWSYNAGTQQLTITAGSGGSFETTSDFTAGDFDGWRVYFPSTGLAVDVVTSTDSGTDIVLDMDYIVSIPSGDIRVVPNADFIELWSGVDEATDPLRNKHFIFNILDGYGDMPLHTDFDYTIKWRHIKSGVSTPWQDVNDGSAWEYTAFDAVGVPTGGGLYTPYTAGGGGINIPNDTFNHLDLMALEVGGNSFSGRNSFDHPALVENDITFFYGAGGTVNDAINTQLTASSIIELTTADLTLTGLAVTGTTSGRIFKIKNLPTSTENLILENQHVGSSAANRFSFSGGVSVILEPDDYMLMYYDGASSRWVDLKIVRHGGWRDIPTTMTFAGTGLGSLSQTYTQSRYKFIDPNTLVVELWVDTTDGGAAQVVSATMPWTDIPIPSGTVWINSNHMGIIYGNATGSHTGSEGRSCSVNVGSAGIQFYPNVFDTGSFTKNASNRMDYRGTFTISLNS